MTESTARRALYKLGYVLCKSRQRSHVPNFDNFGDYMIVDIEGNYVVAGERFDMTLQDIEEWLKEQGKK